MTREEKIAELINIRDNFNYALTPREVFDDAIKALEQQPVLDRIRAEICDLRYGDEEKSMTDENRVDAYNNAIEQVIEIIDKYKAESEE